MQGIKVTRQSEKLTEQINLDYMYCLGARSSIVVKALGYKPEGRRYETRWGEILNLHNPSSCTRLWGNRNIKKK
jgi:hypothetical protein